MDPDDSMASTTPSSGDAALDDDAMFPGSKKSNSSAPIRPQTPQNDHLNASAPGELSPPRSQTNDMRSSFTNGTSLIDEPIVTTSRSINVGSEKAVTDQPGMGWKNKKAQEEMNRSWEFVVDKDFSLKEFGDVVMQGKQQRGEN